MSEKSSRDKLKTVSPGTESVPAIARLCYVDDSRTSAYVVRRLLQPFGYQVDHFSSAEPAFVALIQEDYDLLLTDLKVSANGMDGDDLIRTLRNSGHDKISKLPIIVITGATDAQSLVDVYDAGANQVMKKPVDAEELDGHIRRLLFDGQRIRPTSGDSTVVSLPTAHRPPPVSVSVADSHPDETVPSSSVPPVISESVEPSVTSSMTASETTAVNPAETIVEGTSPVETIAAETPAEAITGAEEKTGGVSGTFDLPDDSGAHDSPEEPVIIEPDMRSGRGKGFNENILHDLDQHALVVSERSDPLVRSGIVGLLHSLVELVGMRRLLMRGLILGLTLVLLVAGWNMYFNKGLAVETAFVESGEIFQSITVPGRLVSKQRVDVSPARAGRLVEVLVEEGDRVSKGEVLAKLDDRELLSRLKVAKANLTNASEGIVLAERTLKRLRKAHDKGAVARRFVEDAEVDLRAAKAKAGVAVEEVHSATLDFNSQKISAAFAGTVTSRLAEIGQWVGPSDTLFTLVDESQREIEVRVDSADSVAIDIGQVVAVSTDAFPGLEWEESVVRLGTATDNNKNANSVKVYISLGKDAPLLRIGQQVDADIRTAWNPNTLKVPFEALITRDGQTMVAVLSEGQVRMKAVEIGIEDFAMAEIKQGLNEGEMVILTKGMPLQNGDKVHPKRVGE
jgi:RND family efflux transporter MFP subunit